jgi:methyl-accepting chemotaxis protein
MAIDAIHPTRRSGWRISDMSISTWLFLIGFVSVAASLLAGGFLISEMNALSTKVSRIHNEQYAVSTALRDIKLAAAGVNGDMHRLGMDAHGARAGVIAEGLEARAVRIEALYDLVFERSEGDVAPVAQSRAQIVKWREEFDAALAKNAVAEHLSVADDKFAAINDGIDGLLAKSDERGASIVAGAIDARKRAMWISILVLAVGALVVCGVTVVVARSILRPMAKLNEAAVALAKGMPSRIPGTTRPDAIGVLARSLSEVSSQARAGRRIRAALDSASAAMAITDAELTIVYANPAMLEIVRGTEDHWRARHPGFTAEDLVGMCIDDFHERPEKQRATLSSKTSSHQTEIAFAGVVARLDLTPIDGDDGCEGYVMQWTDRTVERAAETQIETVIKAAQAGDFSARVEVKNAARFIVAMAAGMNNLCETVQSFLGDIDQALSGLAHGDLRGSVEGEYGGQLGEIAERVDQTAKEIDRLVGKIVAATVGINRSSAEISDGSNDLSIRAESQAASLEETAATMEEIAATVKNNAENAFHANRLASETRAEAERGRAVTAETVQAMANIRESATEISDIVTTIDAIAFQTNLLALNAAVEAARAGDAGKGFAVVASEVRTLAQRSGEAAKTIKELIEKSNEQVATGDRLVSSTDAALAGILEGVRNVAAKIEEIANASREQTAGVDEVSSTVSQMDEMTQQNASMADESAAAARSLTEQSAALVELVKYFKTRESRDARPTSREVSAWERDAAEEKRAAAPTTPRQVSAVATGSDWAEF